MCTAEFLCLKYKWRWVSDLRVSRGGGKKRQGLGFLGKGEFHGIIWDDMGSCLGIPCRVVQVEGLPFLGGGGEE